MDPTGEMLIRWTIRLAMACYAAVLAGAILSRRPPATSTRMRYVWTAGCVLFGAHMLAAFAFYHHWSHAHAYLDTAEKTAAALGWRFGGGIYFNHLFAIVWVVDVLWSWVAAANYRRRPAWVTAAVHGFLLFIALNGLVVFKGGAVRWVSLAVGAALLGLWATVLRVRMRNVDYPTP